MITTANPEQIQHFSNLAEDWWNPHGAFQSLHRLTAPRLDYIKAQVEKSFPSPDALKNLTVLDVGCGGGIICEALARCGAIVTGIDASRDVIQIAQEHAQQSGLSIRYEVSTPEQFAEKNPQEKYDLILGLEIVEHIQSLDIFARALVQVIKPDGLVILSSLNKTYKAFFLGVVMAEYILNWVPVGTHDWNNFHEPSELIAQFSSYGCEPIDLTGLIYSPLSGRFVLSPNKLKVNYFLTLKHVTSND